MQLRSGAMLELLWTTLHQKAFHSLHRNDSWRTQVWWLRLPDLLWHRLYLICATLWTEASAKMNTFKKNSHFWFGQLMMLLLQKEFSDNSHRRYVISSYNRWTGEQEAGCTEWPGFSQSTVWVHNSILCFDYFWLCDLITHSWRYLIWCTVFMFQQFAPLPLYVHTSSPLSVSQSISNPKPLPCSVFSLSLSYCLCTIAAIGAQLAALAQQRWDLIAFSWMYTVCSYVPFVYV